LASAQEPVDPGFTRPANVTGDIPRRIPAKRTDPKFPRPIYECGGSEVVASSPDADIGVTYRGTPVDRVTRSVIRLKNFGPTTISDRDVRSPVTVDFGEASLLGEPTVLMSSPGRATPTIDPDGAGRVVARFEYLEPHDEVVFGVLHTGVDERPESVTGRIEHVTHGIEDRTETQLRHVLASVGSTGFAFGVASAVLAAGIVQLASLIFDR
jgi:hypothetical protein